MKKHQYFICLLFLWLFSHNSISLLAESQTFPIRRISPSGGFTLGPVVKIAQDKHGFIWFITREKLYQHNSQDFISFNPKFQGGISHTNNNINSLLIDRSNTIWVGTNAGLTVFNYHLWQLETVNLIDNELPGRTLNITEIKQNKKGEIWILEGACLARIDSASKEINYIKANNSRIIIHAFSFDSQDNIYAANNLGELYYIESQSLQVTKLNADLSPIKLHGIFFIGNILWITSDGHGLRRYTTEGKLIDRYFQKADKSNELYSNRIREVLQTSDRKIWIATYKGLLEWNEGRFKQYFSEFDNPFSLPDNSVVSLLEDKQKGLWIGTWRGGLSYVNNFSNTFEKYQHSPYKNSVSGNLINAIVEGSNGEIWIGTDGHGLDVFDVHKKSFRHVALMNANQFTVTNIKCIYPTPNGDIWIGTFGQGIFIRKHGESTFKPALLKNTNVYDLVSDGEGLWIATFSDGLYYYRFRDQTIQRYANKNSDPTSLPSNFLRKLLVDSHKNLWVISNAGVSVKPNGKETFDRLILDSELNSASVQVYSITSGIDGTIWLGTDNGILSLDSSMTVSNHSLLFNNTPVSVYGIAAISTEQLWISSNCGIFFYNPITKKYLNYSAPDGIPGNLFNAGAVCQSVSGKIYFGGTSGMVAFDPRQIQINPFEPRVYFSKIFINHEEVLPNQKNSPLEKPFYETETLRLSQNQNSFSIEFVALNYLDPLKNRFRYRLKGFDRNWVEAGNNPRATYTNIASGKYEFEVMACNNDGVWNKEPAMLNIIILRPLLLSNMALTIYILLLLGLWILVRRIVRSRSRLERQIELERIQRLQEEKLHQDKLVFFTNISHELRTPLTLIAGPVESLIKSSNIDQGQFNQLSLIKRNTGRLLKLINQLLEFRKIENQQMELNVCETDMVEFVHNIFDYFLDVAKQKKINYVFVNLYDTIHNCFDTEKIDKALFNLLSNAFKFTPEKGSIQVEITIGQKNKTSVSSPNISVFGELTTKQFVQISVEDNGPGIETQHIEKIFNRFYKVENAEGEYSGTGIGLHLTKSLILLHGGEIEVESVAGKGCIFRIRIPYGINSIQTLKSDSGILINQVSIHPKTGCLSFTDDEINDTFTENWSEATLCHKKNEKLILIVEDYPDLLKFVCNILEGEYRIISANNGKVGIEKARLFLPDIIISDIMMPEKNGIDLVKELKSDLDTCHIPIILLTALTSVDNKIEGFESGADDYIEKPFNSEILKARIKNIFSRREAMQQFFTGQIANGLSVNMSDTPDQKLLAKAIHFVEKNITDEQLSIDILASHLRISRTTLHRKLKVLTNKTTSDFIRTIRLEYAARLLKEGQHNVDEVSLMAGFNSHSYLTRTFKEHFGKTPSDFLAMHQQQKQSFKS